jgi:Ser/Thr protein kinase RdoA (MazF antagonist)
VAQLHQQASDWVLPPGFSRPTHGIDQLQSATLQLATLVEPDVISMADYQVFQETAVQVQQLMSGLPQTRDTWGLIHADLHQGNYVLNGETICPIDFSRCGFGFYLYDIAESLGDIDAALRLHFFEGYTSIRELPTDYQPLVEAFFNGATVENFAFLSTNSQEYDWLARAVPYVVKNHLQPYLRGEDFLFLS